MFSTVRAEEGNKGEKGRGVCVVTLDSVQERPQEKDTPDKDLKVKRGQVTWLSLRNEAHPEPSPRVGAWRQCWRK